MLTPFGLPSVSLNDRHLLPRKSGIYYVFQGSKLLYIGMTRKQGLRSRWTNNAGHGQHHLMPRLRSLHRISEVRIKYRVLPVYRVAHEEAIAIALHRLLHGQLPPLNRKAEPIVWPIVLFDCGRVLGVIGVFVMCARILIKV